MKRILVVDDDKGIRMLYEAELTDEGYDVLTYGGAEMLIQAIEKEKPDLVVMDLKMGGSDGLQLMEQIRRTFKTIPVLLSTAYPAFTLDPKFRATGCFVEKSADLTDLKEKIKNILDKGRDEVHYC